MIPTRQNLERVLRHFVALGADLPKNRVIPGKANVPSPKEPYATVLHITTSKQGTSQSDGLGKSWANMIGEYSVQIFREGSLDKAQRMLLWCNKLGSNWLQERGITFGRIGPITQVDEIVSSEWEERAILTLSVGYYGQLGQDEIETEIPQDFDTIRLKIHERPIVEIHTS